MNNKPVAYLNENTGSELSMDWLPAVLFDKLVIENRQDWIPLYTHPVKELNDGGEPVKNATYWKRQYNLMASQNDNLKSGLYHANEQIKYLESHPVKELTDEEIKDCYEAIEDEGIAEEPYAGIIHFAKAILRKASEK